MTTWDILKVCEEKLTQEENELLDKYIFSIVEKERKEIYKELILYNKNNGLGYSELLEFIEKKKEETIN